MADFLKHIPFRHLQVTILGMLSILGGVIIIYGTSNGPVGWSDSVEYIVSARNLLHGVGLGVYFPDGSFHMLGLQPPFYSVVLCAIGLSGAGLIDAARWLNVLLYSATIFGVGFIFYCFSSYLYFSIFAMISMVIFPILVHISMHAMTEPLFFFLLIWSIFCLLRYLRSGVRRWMLLSALLTGLLPLTRYIGIYMIMVNVISLLLFENGTSLKRLKKAAAFGILASIPILIWVLYAYIFNDHSLAGRQVYTDWGAISSKFMQFRTTTLDLVWGWIPFIKSLPALRNRIRYGIVLLAIIAVIGVTLFAKRHVPKGDSPMKGEGDVQIFSIFGLSVIFFIFTLGLSFIFLNTAPGRIDNRQLLPIYFGIMMSLLGALCIWQMAWFHRNWSWLKILPYIIIPGCMYWYYPQTMSVINQSHQGVGYLTNSWRNSETMNAVRELPKSVPIVSNNAAAILLWADHPGYELLEEIKPEFINQTSPYGSDLSDRAQVVFRQQGAALVIFGDNFFQTLGDIYGKNGRTREQSLFNGLIIHAKYSDGIIYFYPADK